MMSEFEAAPRSDGQMTLVEAGKPARTQRSPQSGARSHAVIAHRSDRLVGAVRIAGVPRAVLEPVVVRVAHLRAHRPSAPVSVDRPPSAPASEGRPR